MPQLLLSFFSSDSIKITGEIQLIFLVYILKEVSIPSKVPADALTFLAAGIGWALPKKS